MSKDLKTFDPEDRLLDFTVRIFRHTKSFEKREFDFIFVLSYMASLKRSAPQTLGVEIFLPRSALLRNSKFLVRYSIFVFKFPRTLPISRFSNFLFFTIVYGLKLYVKVGGASSEEILQGSSDFRKAETEALFQ